MIKDRYHIKKEENKTKYFRIFYCSLRNYYQIKFLKVFCFLEIIFTNFSFGKICHFICVRVRFLQTFLAYQAILHYVSSKCKCI